MTTRLGVILASVRQNRMGGPVGEWVCAQARAHGGFDVDCMDLRDAGLSMYDEEPEHPARGRYEHPATMAWSQRVSACQAFIIVTPEYNHGYPAPLKNALDRLHHEWVYRPVGFVSYGGAAGGVRSVQQLIDVVVSLRMVVVPDAVSAPYVTRQIDTEFLPDDGQKVKMRTQLEELDKLARALAPLQQA